MNCAHNALMLVGRGRRHMEYSVPHLVEAVGDFPLRQAEHDAVDVDVLSTRDFRMEAGAKLDERGNAAAARIIDLKQIFNLDFQHSRFSALRVRAPITWHNPR